MAGKIDIVIGGQWGSESKGKLAGYLARRRDYVASVCNFSPNAGHTFVDDFGKHVVTQLPTAAAACPGLPLYICAGAAINPDKLAAEIEEYGVKPGGLFIDPLASVITQEHRDMEAEILGRISSTLKGCGASLGSKVMRKPGHKLARDLEPPLSAFVAGGRVSDMVEDTLEACEGDVLYETAQGFDLSINHGLEYPFVTSRDVTPMSVMDELGVHWSRVGEVWGCLRTYPIRVGGPSGPSYPGQAELTWDNIMRLSASREPILERTTVTNKVRRVFEFSWRQLDKFLMVCRPTHIFINFINYISALDTDKTSKGELTGASEKWLKDLAWAMPPGVRVALAGTGAHDNSMVEL